MNGPLYHRLLQYHVLPELRQWNGGNLDRLVWQQVFVSSFQGAVYTFENAWQDGAPCHVTNANMRYLDSQFAERVISRKPVRGRDWPARSPDLNPCDFCLWEYLKSKVKVSIMNFGLSLHC